MRGRRIAPAVAGLLSCHLAATLIVAAGVGSVIAGAAMVLVEAVPASLSEAVTIPAIGIGAGPETETDGQVLVLHDMLGLSKTGRAPKFVKNFMKRQPDIQGAIKSYIVAVKDGSFPAKEHCCSE